MLTTVAAAPLIERLEELKAREGSLRARDAAARLGVPEAALLEVQRARGAIERLAVSGKAVGDLLARLEEVGDVMALTRNDHCVHEKTGTFRNLSFHGTMATAFGPEIDLRMFLERWASAFHVVEPTDRGERHSLQFFDETGTAVHKVYAVGATDVNAFLAVAARFRDPAPAPLRFKEMTAPPPARPDEEIDLSRLRAEWLALENGHRFDAMLSGLGVGRAQALRLAGPEFAMAAVPDAADRMLHAVAASGLPIMCFVRNRGCVQIHSGPVERIKRVGPWLNVLDPRFNLHLKDGAAASVHVVRKASSEKAHPVTSLELYDAAEEPICRFYAVREAGAAEPAAWRDLLDGLCRPSQSQ